MRALSGDEMYRRLMALHRHACATGRYDVSYYLLSAMWQLASEMGDEARLLEVSREVRERLARLAVAQAEKGQLAIAASAAMASWRSRR
jgi:uncharacterized lipoprotein YmbA